MTLDPTTAFLLGLLIGAALAALVGMLILTSNE